MSQVCCVPPFWVMSKLLLNYFKINLIFISWRLEQESKIFFNMNYFGEFVISGEWDKALKYLSAFTMPDDNQHSAKIVFTLEKQKYLANLGRWVLDFYVWVFAFIWL